MATEIETRFVDDIDRSAAAETVKFTIDGMALEIDLSEANATAFRLAVAPYVQHARPQKVKGKGGQKRNREVNPETVAAREWWRREGGRNGVREFQGKGRIPADVMELFRAAGAPGVLALVA
jgi:hypothetical protein